jgi:glutamine amidotransferase
VLNCHPFQYGRWVFAHNGDIPNFSSLREQLLQRIPPRLRRFILGDTDSETVFYLLLTELERLGPLNRPHSVTEVVTAVQRTSQLVRQLCDQAEQAPSLLTFIVTDGSSLVGVHGGKELFLSTHKHRCPERERCPSLSAECEAPSQTGFVNHFILSSEPLQGSNVWEPLKPGEIVAVDARMKVMRTELDRVSLPLVARAS